MANEYHAPARQRAGRCRGEAGLTLLESLIAIGVLAAGMAAFMQMFEQQSRMARGLRHTLQFQSVTSTIQQLLANPVACRKALADTGKRMNPNAAFPQEVGDLTIDGVVIASTTQALEPGLVVRNIRWVNTPPPVPIGTNGYLVTLRIIAEKFFPGQTANGQILDRDFQVFVTVSPAGGFRITSCEPGGAVPVVVTANAACGATATAVCPAGTRLVTGGAEIIDGPCGGGNLDSFESRPDGNGWKCGWDDGTGTCYAVCEP